MLHSFISFICLPSHFEDQRLPLLVHWTLWDALLCSPCLGPRLQTFSEKGRETIKLLLMGMGVPLEPAKGSWSTCVVDWVVYCAVLCTKHGVVCLIPVVAPGLVALRVCHVWSCVDLQRVNVSCCVDLQRANVLC